jgi:nucleotide-binding universal stress UspA family protein
MYKHILIPTDGSALSAIAVREGIAFAKSINAKVTALTVSATFHSFSIDPLTVTDTLEQYRKDCDARAKRHLGMVKDAAEGAGVPFAAAHVVHDLPPRSDHQYRPPAGGCDLIFMASHGRKGMAALLIGSETMKVLTHSNIPVPGLSLIAGQPARRTGADGRGLRDRSPSTVGPIG